MKLLIKILTPILSLLLIVAIVLVVFDGEERARH